MKTDSKFIFKYSSIVCKNSIISLCQQFSIQHKLILKSFFKNFTMHLLNLAEYELINNKQLVEILIFANKQIN